MSCQNSVSNSALPAFFAHCFMNQGIILPAAVDNISQEALPTNLATSHTLDSASVLLC
jgi:hypothetical protein